MLLRDLSKERYVYIWADGIYFNIRSDDSKQCILVIIGVTSQDDKEFLAIGVAIENQNRVGQSQGSGI